jgi:hypothetical protein
VDGGVNLVGLRCRWCRANRSRGWCALHLRKARGTIMVHSLDALR